MRLVFLDTETTGTNSQTGRIIEVAAILYQDGQILDTFHTLINPQCPIDPFITQITGIKGSDLINSPAFEDIALQLRDFLEGSTLVAHNARFDYGFLRTEFQRVGIKYISPILCTVRLSRKLFPEHHHHNLDSIIKRFNFPCENRHRAYDDAKILIDFYNHIQTIFSPDDLKSKINDLLGHPSLPLHVPDATLQNIPDYPGVYIFYSQDHQPLYIGKSNSLKSRVLSHFYESIHSSKEMKLATFTYDIETIPTAGELSALLLESKLVKELQPTHNRLLRLKKKLIVLLETVNPEGYLTLTPQIVDSIDIEQLDKFVGVFRSQKQIKNYLSVLAEEHQLCPKILGLDNSKSSCFSYHLGKCKGACKSEEKPLFYNLRHQLAFQKTRLKRWPFPSPILITEYHPESEISQSFLVDQWCLLGEFSHEMDNEILHSSDYSFDIDTYKILLRFILDPKNQSKIKILKT